MQILRRQGTPDHLLERAQQALRDALGGARHLLAFTPGKSPHQRQLVHALTGHHLGTPRDGTHTGSSSVLAYSEALGVRYVDYVFDDNTVNPILEVTLDPVTGRESFRFHDDHIGLLSEGLTQTLMGASTGDQHALVLAATLATLNARYGLNLVVAAFTPAAGDSPDPRSHAVIAQGDLVMAVNVSGTSLVGYVNADESAIATFIPTDDDQLTWALLDEANAQIIAQNFHDDSTPPAMG